MRKHDAGFWASGSAVVERLADSITAREGLLATLEFMEFLHIQPDCQDNILTLALKKLRNN